MPLETCLSSFVGVFWCSFSCVATFQQWMTFPYLLELSRKPNSHLIEGAAPDPPKFYSTITTEQQQWAPAQKEAARSPAQRVFAWYGHLFETLLKILEMKKLCLHIITNKENCKKKKKIWGYSLFIFLFESMLGFMAGSARCIPDLQPWAVRPSHGLRSSACSPLHWREHSRSLVHFRVWPLHEGFCLWIVHGWVQSECWPLWRAGRQQQSPSSPWICSLGRLDVHQCPPWAAQPGQAHLGQVREAQAASPAGMSHERVKITELGRG